MKHAHAGKNHYVHLLIMTSLSFVSMYVLMYAMVDRVGNVYGNLNQLYMAGLMTAPMILIELAVMGGMYENKGLNAAIRQHRHSPWLCCGRLWAACRRWPLSALLWCGHGLENLSKFAVNNDVALHHSVIMLRKLYRLEKLDMS